jgi:hypothetical protein
MARARIAPLIWLWTTAALGGLAWGLVAVVFASVAPPQFVPRLFFSYHVEHFAAFYLIAILAAAGLPTLRLHQITFALILMALLLATVRLIIPQHRLADAEDLAADLAGIGAAVAPLLVGRLRHVAALSRSGSISGRP